MMSALKQILETKPVSNKLLRIIWVPITTYSGDPKTDHLKTGLIQKPDILRVHFWILRISNDQISSCQDHSYSNVPNHLKSGQHKMAFSQDCCVYKHKLYLYIKQCRLKMSSFQMVGTTRPFINQTKSTIWNPDKFVFQIPTIFKIIHRFITYWLTNRLGVKIRLELSSKHCKISKWVNFWQFWSNKMNIPPFDNQTQICHLNTRLVWYSDGYCTSL